MTKAYPLWPGIPAGGHVTRGGHWHPGSIDTCHKCHDCPPFPQSDQTARVRYLHHIEAGQGWVYKARIGTEPPVGWGWEVNVDAGNDGHAITRLGDGTKAEVTYWRRYAGRADER